MLLLQNDFSLMDGLWCAKLFWNLFSPAPHCGVFATAFCAGCQAVIECIGKMRILVQSDAFDGLYPLMPLQLAVGHPSRGVETLAGERLGFCCSGSHPLQYGRQPSLDGFYAAASALVVGQIHHERESPWNY
jgi:hypothetical protein